MNDIALLLVHRLTAALGTIPDSNAWLQTGGLALLLAVAAALLGIRSGFLRWRPLRAPWPAWFVIALAAFVAPALAEELAFRALPLPGPGERASVGAMALWGAVSLAAFVLYHPLKSRLLPARRDAPFTHPIFLALATLLGAVCTVSYVLSGSLWPPVVLHWFFVSVWLLLLDGWTKMGFKTERPSLH